MSTPTLSPPVLPGISTGLATGLATGFASGFGTGDAHAGGASFGDALRLADANAAAEGLGPDDLRSAAHRLVATTFIQPVLAILRSSAAPVGAFAPGAAERRFGPLLDQVLAERISTSANFPLVDAVERRLQPASAPETETEPERKSLAGEATTPITSEIPFETKETTHAFPLSPRP